MAAIRNASTFPLVLVDLPRIMMSRTMKELYRPVAALCAVLTTLACGTSSSPAPAASPTPAPDSEWPVYSHDSGHTNANLQETTLSQAGVGALAQVFQVNIGFNGAFGSNSTPIISGGHVYVGSSVLAGNNFLAYDATTGGALWSANLGHASGQPCGPVLNVGIPSTAAISGSTLVVGGGD